VKIAFQAWPFRLILSALICSYLRSPKAFNLFSNADKNGCTQMKNQRMVFGQRLPEGWCIEFKSAV
jgi:hypothetical protein